MPFQLGCPHLSHRCTSTCVPAVLDLMHLCHALSVVASPMLTPLSIHTTPHLGQQGNGKCSGTDSCGKEGMATVSLSEVVGE